MPAASVQDKVSNAVQPAAWEPRVGVNHSHIRVLRRVYVIFNIGKNRYNLKLWKSFVDCFNYMPVAALVEDKILCMHGGLSPELISLDQINQIARPTDIPDTGLLCDLLWADPETSVKLWGES